MSLFSVRSYQRSSIPGGAAQARADNLVKFIYWSPQRAAPRRLLQIEQTDQQNFMPFNH